MNISQFGLRQVRSLRVLGTLTAFFAITLIAGQVRAAIVVTVPTADDFIQAQPWNAGLIATVQAGDSFFTSQPSPEFIISGKNATTVEGDHDFAALVPSSSSIIDAGGGGTYLSSGTDTTPQFRRQVFGGNALLFRVFASEPTSSINVTGILLNGTQLPDLAAFGINAIQGQSYLVSGFGDFSGIHINQTITMDPGYAVPGGADSNYTVSLIQSSSVPEPSSALLLAVVSCGLLALRHRRAHLRG